MGTESINIADTLFPKVKQRVLGLLYSQPDKDFYTNEIIRFADMGVGVVQRELAKLCAAGIITVISVGDQKRYQANRNGFLFPELHRMVLKTFGCADVLREALLPTIKKIDIAFIYGSIAKQEDIATSDIDLMLIGEDVTYADVFALLSDVEPTLGRKINPTCYLPKEWTKKYRAGNHFLVKIDLSSKIFLVGTQDELEKLR